MPEVYMRLMKVFWKKWRQAGLTVFINLNDIFFVDKTESRLGKALNMVLRDMVAAGMLINHKKSILTPTPKVHLSGVPSGIGGGLLKLLPENMKDIRKELRKVLTHIKLSCRKKSAILGTFRSVLSCLPFLRCFTDSIKEFSDNHSIVGWYAAFSITTSGLEQAVAMKGLLMVWPGGTFQPPGPQRLLYSDATT